jgi:Mrp family chromosome partitioning ATPase
MAAIVDSLRQSYDLVVIDAPSLLVNSDSVMLMDLADGAVLVVRSGITPGGLVSKALEQIDEIKLRGIVLNGSQSAIPGWLRRLCGM